MKKIKGFLAVVLVLTVFAVMALGSGSSSSTASSSVSNSTQGDATDKDVTDATKEEQTEASKYDISVAADSKNMKLGDIAKDGNLYISLAYVRKADKFYNSLSTEDVSADHEVLYVFMEAFNASSGIESFSDYGLSVYVDGVQVNGVDSYFLAKIDGVSEMNSYKLDAETKAIALNDFEVAKDWKELKVFYGSSMVWTVSADQVNSESYSNKEVISVTTDNPSTTVGEVVYSDKFEATYDGFEVYTDNNMILNKTYAVFKYTIKNTNSDALDTSLWGHNMRFYKNNLLQEDADYVMNDNISGYNNVFSVEKIQSGMAAKVYVAFPIESTEGKFSMAFDDGYITNDLLFIITN